MGDPASDDEDDSVSRDQALLELLGISSLDAVPGKEEESVDYPYCCLPSKSPSLEDLLRVHNSYIAETVETHRLQEEYQETSVCVFPEQLSVPAEIMRRLTDEVIWGGGDDDATFQVDRTYETIQIWKNGAIHERQTLTRLENLNSHAGWNQLCNDYIRRCISAVMGEEMVLYKTKLNLKPAGGSGFAPHVDAPSLQVALGNNDGPRTFVTVMVAIDTMTVQNGCLRIAKGSWSRDTACPTVAPDTDGNPDAGGRAGAIPLDAAATMEFDDVCCDGGTIVAFNGWVPHRSGANQSHFARRAVFLTYNPASEGDFHDMYYERMARIRNDWRSSVALTTQQPPTSSYEKTELDALDTIPRI